jgi:hypothetical protein
MDYRSKLKNFSTTEFLAPYKSYLEWSGKSRLLYYERIITKLVNLNRPILVVETGTMWSRLEDNMGAFTLVFGDLIKNWTGGKLITIDISQHNIESCKITTSAYSDVIEYVISDSVKYLEDMTDEIVKQIDFIYFDSYDFYVPDPMPSQLHHFRELMGVYKRLSPQVHIAVDDNFLPNCWVEWNAFSPDGSIATITRYDTGPRMFGKGTLIDYFLIDEGWKRMDDWLHIDTYHLLAYEKNPKKTVQEVENILKNFYSNQTTSKLEKTDTTEHLSLFNPSNGLGDSIILTCITPSKKINNKVIESINSEYFDSDNLTDEFDLSVEEISKWDLGGGHCTQTIQKYFGLEPSVKPSGKLKFDNSQKESNKVFIHFKNGTDWKRKIPNSLNDEEIETIKEFFSKNENFKPYYYDNDLNLNDLISVMETCEYFLGIDSGPMHVAAALGLKSIIIVNDPNCYVNLPKIKECEVPNSEWLYPQNVHLNRSGVTELVPKYNIQNLLFAFKGEIYPYWSDEYLNIKY